MKFGSQRHFPSFAHYKKRIWGQTIKKMAGNYDVTSGKSLQWFGLVRMRAESCVKQKVEWRFGNTMVVLNNEYLIKLMNNYYQIF